ncbi:hypothetical protein JAAARDRAFT_63790 [Jaapia argillacea MUCL 33604]|uniref:Uncharacterized protein n=1 Tax=Jaapia argillacea MUCL 33604 TaxID=933084 RepID=A0A067P600_9AGAM|nr:hypothetical protein JAAARDRAFT_63790 [Jaapia argillacea MUCL 33604]
MLPLSPSPSIIQSTFQGSQASRLSHLPPPCSEFPLERYSPNKPLEVRGFLELATKYQADRLWDYIVRNLVADWPQWLPGWDALEREYSSEANELAEHLDENEIVDVEDSYPEPASAIRIATDFDIPEILPAAFYALSQL